MLVYCSKWVRSVALIRSLISGPVLENLYGSLQVGVHTGASVGQLTGHLGGTGAGVGATGAGVGATGAGVGATGAGVGATGAGVGATGAGVGGTGAGVGNPTGQYLGLPNFFPPGRHLSRLLLLLLLPPLEPLLLLLRLLLLQLLESLLWPLLLPLRCLYLLPLVVETAPRFRLLTYFVFWLSRFAALL
jgi:hypothetical protein